MLTGEKVTLRALEDRDLALLRQWRNDPEMAQWHCSAWPLSEDAQRAWYETQKERCDGQAFMIETDGKALGYAVCMGLDARNRSIETGIHLAANARCKGYGKDAFVTLVRFCFEELNVHRVWLRVYAFNEHAIKLYEKMGFQTEGAQRDAVYTKGAYQDIVVMSILENEWRERG